MIYDFFFFRFNQDNIVTCSRDGSAIIWIPRSRRSHVSSPSQLINTERLNHIFVLLHLAVGGRRMGMTGLQRILISHPSLSYFRERLDVGHGLIILRFHHLQCRLNRHEEGLVKGFFQLLVVLT